MLACSTARQSLVSPHGDPFTLLNVFEEWLRVKASGGGGGGGGRGNSGSARWARRHGVAEARLYEAAKLVQQYRELLTDAGLLRCVCMR